MARLEFQGSLYMGDDGPVLPADLLEATFINGAKKTKEGTLAKPAFFVSKNSLIEYNGPKDRDGLWADVAFRIVSKVKIGQSSVFRTRPIFNDWAATVEVNYDDQQVNQEQVVRWIETSGSQVGFGDWRPKYGRFQVVSVSNGKN